MRVRRALGNVGRAAGTISPGVGVTVVAGVRPSRVTEAKELGVAAIVPADDTPSSSFDAAIDTVGGAVAEANARLPKPSGTGFARFPASRRNRRQCCLRPSSARSAGGKVRGDIHFLYSKLLPTILALWPFECLRRPDANGKGNNPRKNL